MPDPAPPPRDDAAITLRIERTKDGFRWEIRRDYSETCVSGMAARLMDVSVALMRICEDLK